MRYLLKKLAALLRYFGDLLDGGPPAKPALVPPPAEADKLDVMPIRVEPQREVPYNKRKLLLLLAKDELTEAEQAEMNELTAGKEIIILEDT